MRAPSILVIRADDRFSASLREVGLKVTNLPLIGTRRLDDQTALLQILPKIREYDGIFFTSPASAEVFVAEAGRIEPAPRLYAMGGRSKEVLEQAGYITERQPKGNTAAEFVNSFDDTEFREKKLLFVRGDRSLLTIPSLLKDKAEVEEVVVYETVENRPDDAVLQQISKKLDEQAFDWVCFFSPSAVESFARLFGTKSSAKLAVIGATTAASLKKLGRRVDFISPRASARDFSMAFSKFINGN